MRTRRIIFSSLLLVVATMFNAVFAQSAEEAAKYGQLQEIQLTKAGQLSKFIKKEDPNVKALKLSGEFNAKDWELLYSLPNIAYLDLQEVQNVAKDYKYKDESGTKRELGIGEGELLLFSSESLKFLAVPHNVTKVSLPNQPKYSLDMLVADCGINFIRHKLTNEKTDREASIKLLDVKISTSDTPSGNDDKELAVLLSMGIDPSSLSAEMKNLGTIMGYLNSLGDKYSGSRPNCRTLYIMGNKKGFRCEKLDPQEIVIESTGERILNYYVGDSKVVNLNDYNMIIARAFEGKNIEEVNTGEKITNIPDNCFWDIRTLKRVIMPAVKTIGTNAFYDCYSLDIVSAPRITHVGKNAFPDHPIREFQYTYKLPANAENLDLSALVWTGVTKIDLTEHQYAPDLILPRGGKEDQYMKKQVEFIIPANAYKHRYNVGNWKEMHVIEEGAKDTYTFQLDSIGSLRNYINDDNAINVQSLTLTGVMDETDFEVIRKCKNLKYLDLTHCFTFQSAQNAKADYEANVFMLQLYSLAFSADRQKKEQQYEHYEATTEEVQAARIRENWLKGLGVDDITSEDIDAMFGNRKVIYRETCWLPKYALTGLYRLEELKLPLMLLQIKETDLFYGRDEYDKKSLRKVHLSEDLTYLGREIFEGATNLTEINFPDSLQYIGISCFRKSGLKKVDLSKTKIKYLGDSAPKDATNMLYTDAFADCQLQEFHSPVGMQYTTQWYDGSSLLLYWWSNEAIIYMNIPEPFCKAGSFSTYKELHIPRGQKAAWRGYSNLIDDIDLDK